MAVALSYLLVYIPANEKYLNERRFKAIQRVKRNIDEKQLNTFQLIQTLSDTYATDTLNGEILRQYLDFRFGPGKDPEFFRATKKRSISNLKDTLVPETAVYLPNAKALEENISFLLKRVTRRDTVEFSMNYSAPSFFSPLLPGAGFDEFVILVNRRVMFETFPSGLDNKSFDTLVQVTPKFSAANTKSIKLGGANYQAYIQPFSIGSVQGDALIIGLIHEEKYRAEKEQLPSQKIIWVLTLTILVIILLPWLKLFNMGTRDRLTIWDGALSFVVAMLLVSVIFLGFSILAIRYQPENYRNGLENLADAIEKQTGSFMSEMKVRLDNYDNLVRTEPGLRNDIIFLGDTTGKRGWGRGFGKSGANLRPDTSVLSSGVFSSCFDPAIFQVFWLNRKNGKEMFNWSSEKWNGPHGNYSKRNYFKEHADKTIEYASEQVVSWTTGTFRTLISKKSSVDSLVACISFDLTPLTSALLPGGYGFAVIDQNGEVMYHSNTIHNLNENFADETSEPELVKNIIKSQTQQHLLTKYKGAETNLFVRPVSFDGFRYSIVMFYDQELELIKETGAFSFTLIMLFLFFLIALGQLVIVVVVSSRKTKLNKISLETDWIWPRPSLKKVYDYSGSYQFFVLLLMASVYYFTNFLSFIFILLISVSAITGYVNILYRRHYGLKGLQRYVNYKNRNLLAIVVFLLVVNCFALLNLYAQEDQLLVMLIFQVLLVIGGWVFFKAFDKGDPYKHDPDKDARKFLKSYSRMAITRLIITSGLPALFLYQYAYNYQLSLVAHHNHIDYFRHINPAHPNGPQFQKLNTTGVYFDQYWISNLNTSPVTPIKPTTTDSSINEILNRFRVYNTSGSHTLDAYATTNMVDSPFSYSPPLGSFKRMKGFSTYLKYGENQFAALSSSNKLIFRFPSIFNTHNFWQVILFWIGFFSIIYLLYKAIIRVVQHIFALNIPGERLPADIIKNILEDEKSNRQVYLTGLPGSGKRTFIETFVSREGSLNVDFYQPVPPRMYWGDKKYIIISQFEYVVQSKAKCNAAIILLEKMMLQAAEKSSILILSTIPPDRILALIESLFAGAPTEETHSITERYRVLLSYFNSLILPIQHFKGGFKPGERRAWAEEEFGISEVINKLKAPLYKKYPQPETYVEGGTTWQTIKHWFDEREAEHNEQITWSVQNIAGPFYQHIWESLCPEEKFLIYDLAEEGLVNQTNKYHLSMLIQKGLIIRKEPNGQPELMNDSFRSYILTSVNRAEALELQNEVKGSGSWSDLGRPLTLVALGILAILLISQKQAYASIFGFLSAIAAAIPMLNAIFSVVKSSQSGGTK